MALGIGTVTEIVQQTEMSKDWKVVEDEFKAIEGNENCNLLVILDSTTHSQLPEHSRILSNDMRDQVNTSLINMATNPNPKKLQVMIHSNGGSASSARMISSTIDMYTTSTKQSTTAIVPFKAYSAGTILALSCDSIMLNPVASFSAIDTQLSLVKDGHRTGFFSASNWTSTNVGEIKSSADINLKADKEWIEKRIQFWSKQTPWFYRPQYVYRARNKLNKFADGTVPHYTPMTMQDLDGVFPRLVQGVPDAHYMLLLRILVYDEKWCSHWLKELANGNMALRCQSWLKAQTKNQTRNQTVDDSVQLDSSNEIMLMSK